MNIKKLILSFAVILLSGTAVISSAQGKYPTKVVPLPDVLTPGVLQVDTNHVYITEYATVYIYDKKDFKLRAKFGRDGEGPQEFKLSGIYSISLTVKPDSLEIYSPEKISLYKKDGTFIKEMRVNFGMAVGWVSLLGDRFLVFDLDISTKPQHQKLTIYSPKKEKIREIAQRESPISDKEYLMVSPLFREVIYGDRIYVVNGTEFEIDTFNFNGEKVMSLKRDYKKIKIPEDYKKKVIDLFKGKPHHRQMYREYKDKMYFPDYFPAICTFHVIDDRIYVRTNKGRGSVSIESEFYLFTLDGKFIKELSIPIIDREFDSPYPYAIQGGHIYQLIENEDTDEWELHITGIDVQ